MTGKSGIWIDKLKGRMIRPFNRDVAVFGFFLLLSFVLWYLNSLRKDFEMDLKYPVRFINPPAGMMISGEMPSKLTLSLRGPGYSIVKLRISGNRAPLVVDFSKVAYRSLAGKKPSGYYITTGGLIQNFSKQLRSEFEIISVKPDTLFVKFGKKPQSAPGAGR